MTEAVSDTNNTLDIFLHKIIDNLDIWRSILYSIVLGDVAISNFNKLGHFTFVNPNYYVLGLSFILVIFEPINRFLYRDFTIRRIEDNQPKANNELWFVLIVFGLEIIALFSLCFGIKDLNDLTHWEFITIYFICNFLLNIYEARAIFLKIKKQDTSFTFWLAIKKVFKGETEFFFFGGDSSIKFEESAGSRTLAYLSEQYVAYNTLFLSAWFAYLLLFFDFWHSIPYPKVLVFFSSVIIITLVFLFDLWTNVRNWILNILLFFSILLFFTSLCGIADDRRYFIIFCLINYVIVSIFYLFTYVKVLFKFIPNLVKKK